MPMALAKNHQMGSQEMQSARNLQVMIKEELAGRLMANLAEWSIDSRIEFLFHSGKALTEKGEAVCNSIGEWRRLTAEEKTKAHIGKGWQVFEGMLDVLQGLEEAVSLYGPGNSTLPEEFQTIAAATALCTHPLKTFAC